MSVPAFCVVEMKSNATAISIIIISSCDALRALAVHSHWTKILTIGSEVLNQMRWYYRQFKCLLNVLCRQRLWHCDGTATLRKKNSNRCNQNSTFNVEWTTFTPRWMLKNMQQFMEAPLFGAYIRHEERRRHWRCCGADSRSTMTIRLRLTHRTKTLT